MVIINVVNYHGINISNTIHIASGVWLLMVYIYTYMNINLLY